MHRRYVEPDHLKRLNVNPPNAEARALVDLLKQALADLFREVGAVHLQVAKAYHYADGLEPGALALVRALKQQLDPARRMNPGSLGL